MGRVAQYRHIVSLHISDRQKAALRCLSEKFQIPVSELMRRAIDEYIQRNSCET
jgi:predicted transcriptional regulator